ncbi:MAG: hypothetical protein ACRDXB_08545 [Actinomycetes bacterium]
MGPISRVGALAAFVLVSGCGSSVADSDSPDPTRRTPTASSSPFCVAAQANLEAIRPLNGLVAQGQVPPDELADTIGAVRRAGADMTMSAPEEIRVDVERTVQALDLQLDVLLASGGDATAITRDTQLTARLNSPEFTGAGERVRAYVERSCTMSDATTTRR